MSKLSAPFLQLAEAILDGARKMYGDDLVSFAVFGSAARGTARPDSDIDILLVCRNLPNGRMKRILEFTRKEWMIAKPHDLKNIFISPVIKTPDEVALGSPLFWDMTECVAILFDEDDFLERSLESVRERLRKNKARKVQKGDRWYWILKEDYVPGEVFEV